MWEFFKKSFQVFKKLYFKLNVFRYLSKKQAILIFAGIAFIVLIFPTNYAHAGFWMAVIAVPLITAIFTGGAIAVANYATKALTWLFLAAGVRQQF